jgi:uncharacterized protein (TIGR00661 family)
MKILYGVQGTGNGHISRANALSDVFQRYPDVEVTWLVSGREPNNLFEAHGQQMYRRGMTFVSEQGQVSYLKTVLNNNPLTLARDIYQLNLDRFDVLITDYEPVLSWAARLRKRKTIGVGHQYAFRYQVPVKGGNFFNQGILNRFAPSDTGLGLHWHHFDQPLLPPICDIGKPEPGQTQDNKIVVYLPFEDQQRVIAALAPISEYEFYLYSPDLVNNGLENEGYGHIKTRALSRQGFKSDVMSAHGVISNSGFELISECLSIGMRLLTKPLHKQVEQLSNAAALEQLGYAQVVNDITTANVQHWLRTSELVRVSYPDVHTAIGEWIVNSQQTSIESLSEDLWANVQVERHTPHRNLVARAAA